VGPVEVLAVGTLTPATGGAPSVDDCLGFYSAFLDDETKTCAPDQPCARCIFARRSLGFVDCSNLDLTISLDNDCAGVLCDASQTCVPERGCVSAVVTCDDASCDTPNEGGAGAGGAGAGAWQALAVPVGATPYDVVGSPEDPSGSLALFVAAGTAADVPRWPAGRGRTRPEQ